MKAMKIFSITDNLSTLQIGDVVIDANGFEHIATASDCKDCSDCFDCSLYNKDGDTIGEKCPAFRVKCYSPNFIFKKKDDETED